MSSEKDENLFQIVVTLAQMSLELRDALMLTENLNAEAMKALDKHTELAEEVVELLKKWNSA